ncbi:MAG: hypothetical protein ACRDZ1_01050 [Acidimicrobiia bacterium]
MDRRNQLDHAQTVLRERHVAAVQRLLPEYVGRVDWSTARLQEEREEALRALLTVAQVRSAWHRERLSDVDIRSLSPLDIVDLPVMTKGDLMENFDSIVTDGRLSRRLCEEHLDHAPGDHLMGEFQVVASGGSRFGTGAGTRPLSAYRGSSLSWPLPVLRTSQRR